MGTVQLGPGANKRFSPQYPRWEDFFYEGQNFGLRNESMVNKDILVSCCAGILQVLLDIASPMLYTLVVLNGTISVIKDFRRVLSWDNYCRGIDDIICHR
jgi:hypothetical protein